MSDVETHAANGLDHTGTMTLDHRFEDDISATAGAPRVYTAVVDPYRKPRMRSHVRPSVSIEPSRPNPAVTYAIGRLIERASIQLKLMSEQLNAGDFIEAALRGYEVGDVLEQIWELRDSRENEFGDVVNLLQGALRKENFEQWDEGKCQRTSEVLAYLNETIDADQHSNIVREMLKADLDPFKALSADMPDADTRSTIP